MVIDKNSPTELLRMAVQCQRHRKFHEAENFCNQILSVIPYHSETLNLLAIILAQTGRYQAANSYFTQALERYPERADFHGNFANALLEQGNVDKAIELSWRSITLDPTRAEVHNILGSALLSQNQAENAIKSFYNALKLQPSYPQALNNLGNALQKLNRMDEAIKSYRHALALKPDYPDALNNLGQALKAAEEMEEAYQCFQQALKLRPDFSKAATGLFEVNPTWMMPLEGSRLLLRRYDAQDAAYLHTLFRDKDFMMLYNRTISHHQKFEEISKKLNQAYKTHPCKSRTVDWIISRSTDQQVIGIANLVDIQFNHRRAEFMIGIPKLADRASGAGLEASLLILDYAFNKVRLNKLTTIVYGDNLSSQNNTLALGFVQESHLREQLLEPISGKFLDLYGNGMTLSDFRANKRLSRLSMHLLRRDITQPC